MSKLDLPATKCNISHLTNVIRTENETNIPSLLCWKFKNIKHNISMIWIQGRVTQIDGNTMKIVDETGECLVHGLNYAPIGSQKPEIGNYAMIVGELESVSNLPEVKAMKIQNLHNNSILETMWPFEVEHLHQNAADLFEPIC